MGPIAPGNGPITLPNGPFYLRKWALLPRPPGLVAPGNGPQFAQIGAILAEIAVNRPWAAFSTDSGLLGGVLSKSLLLLLRLPFDREFRPLGLGSFGYGLESLTVGLVEIAAPAAGVAGAAKANFSPSALPPAY